MTKLFHNTGEPFSGFHAATKLNIRWLIQRDLEHVLAIENDSFEFPWLADDFKRLLSRLDTIGLVAERFNRDNCRTVGYVVYEMAECHLRILNFAVASDCRRQGIGAAMADKLKSRLNEYRRTSLLLEVRESNLPGQLFFRSQGFRCVNVLRGFYRDTDDAAYSMAYRLEDSE